MELEVPVDGGHLWADDTGGPGPVLALLHSGWGDSSIWLPMLRRLSGRFRVIKYDVRGYGQSPAPATPYSQLGDLIAVLDDRNVTEAMVVGYSLGGGTALGLALADPGRVRRLLLLAPGVPDYPWPEDDPYFIRFGELFDAGDRDGLAELGLRTWAAADPGDTARAQVGAAADAYFRLGDFEQPDPPAYDRLGQITAPATVVIGDRDYPMVIDCGEAVAARIPGCGRIKIPGADHMLPLRVPTGLADLIDRLDGSAAA